MALTKQIIRMAAEGGLDTKTDEKNVLPTNFLELENVRSTKTGAFSKRPGYRDYTKDVIGSADEITTGNAVTTFKEELLRYSADKLYSYSESEDKWSDKGSVNLAVTSQYGVSVNGLINTSPSHDTYANLTCYVYQKSNQSDDWVEYRFIDAETGSVVYTGVLEDMTSPMVTNIQGRFFIFYYNPLTTNVCFRTVEFNVPEEVTSEVVVFAAPAANYEMDRIGNRAYVVTAGTTGLSVIFINVDGTASSPVSVSDASSFNRYSVSAEQNSSVRLVYGKNSTNTLRTVLYNADLTYQIHAPVNLESAAVVTTIGAVQDPLDMNRSYVFASIRSTPYFIARYTVTSDGSTTTAISVYQAALQSKPQAYGNKVYFAAVKDNADLASGPPYTLFRTYFVFNEDAKLVAKFDNDAGLFRDLGTLPRFNIEGNSLAFTGAEAAEVQGNLDSSQPNVATKIKKFILDFDQLKNYFDATMGDNLHVVGGLVKMYDGTNIVEHGFVLNPESPVFVSDSTGGTPVLANGSYQWIAVYKWVDKWGQVHRSAPSLPMTHAISGGPKSVTLTLPTLPFTEKENVEIEVYRTEVNGKIFYKRSHEYGNLVFNDKTVDSVQITDNLADADLISGELLYTEGEVLENAAASSCKHIVTYKSRVFLLLSDGNTLQYSKKREQNGPVEFANEFKISVNEAGGPGVCLATMDDYILIFKERAIFALTGEGPNALGEQDDFREPQLVTSDAGCVDPNSIVNTPNGVMFKSSKGIYIIGRNFQVQYLGAPVERYNDLQISSANLLSDKNEIRFTTDTELSLVYDYFHNRWSVDRNIDAVDAVMYRNLYTYLRGNGELMYETPTQFSDNGSYIGMKLSSSWIQVAGIQGFERFYKMLILGGYKTPHLLKVKFAYDFNPAWVHEVTINTETVFEIENFGEDGDFGDAPVFGGEYPLYQFEIRPKIQKCQAFKFCIEDFKLDGNGEGLTLSNFAAEVGLKQGTNKVGTSKSFGAT